jgi:hypothetical protein
MLVIVAIFVSYGRVQKMTVRQPILDIVIAGTDVV